MIDRISESNSNTGLYAAGWYSRPFLKKGEPTDEYVNTAAKKIVKALPEELTTNLKSVVDKFNNAKSTGELRTMLTDSIKALYKDIDFEKAKGYLKNTNDNLSLFGLKTFDAEDIAGVAITELGRKMFTDAYEKRVDPRGKVYYWMAGELITEPDDAKTDLAAVRNNKISITPVTYEMTRTEIMEDLDKILCGSGYCNWYE